MPNTAKQAIKRYPVLPPIRCSEDEKSQIKELAVKAGLSLSEYVRRMALEGRIIVRHQHLKFDFELARQLRKIGVNLNQQTKKLNAFGELDSDHKRIWIKLESVLDQIMNPE